jgi:hypothetical protein
VGGEVAELLPRDVIVVVHGEPVDGEAGDLVELVDTLGDPGSAEQFGEGVGLVFAQAQRDLARIRSVFLVGESDEITVAGPVGDHAGFAAIGGDEGMQNTHPGKFDPPNVDHCDAPFEKLVEWPESIGAPCAPSAGGHARTPPRDATSSR